MLKNEILNNFFLNVYKNYNFQNSKISNLLYNIRYIYYIVYMITIYVNYIYFSIVYIKNIYKKHIMLG